MNFWPEGNDRGYHSPARCPQRARNAGWGPRKERNGMKRRNGLKGAGAGAAVAETGAWAMGNGKAGAETARQRGMARGLTVLNIRRNGEDRLGVKTDKGILDVQEAARLLRMRAPASVDDLLQHEDG